MGVSRRDERHVISEDLTSVLPGPGSFLEVTKIIEELPKSHGRQPAFHVVALSLPNYGFSEGSKKKGFAIEQYAETGHKLMLKLGYNEYVTQGGMSVLPYVNVAVRIGAPDPCSTILL
jgi:hypothetical protein